MFIFLLFLTVFSKTKLNKLLLKTSKEIKVVNPGYILNSEHNKIFFKANHFDVSVDQRFGREV